MTPSDVAIGVDLDTDAATAEARVREVLAAEGFGVLTEIDVTATLKTKIGAEIPPYKILGACNPSLAHRAISVDPTVGLLLPCNVVIRSTETATRVEFADPLTMLALIEGNAMHDIATEARERLVRAAAALTADVAPIDRPR